MAAEAALRAGAQGSLGPETLPSEPFFFPLHTCFNCYEACGHGGGTPKAPPQAQVPTSELGAVWILASRSWHLKLQQPLGLDLGVLLLTAGVGVQVMCLGQ